MDEQSNITPNDNQVPSPAPASDPVGLPTQQPATPTEPVAASSPAPSFDGSGVGSAAVPTADTPESPEPVAEAAAEPIAPAAPSSDPYGGSTGFTPPATNEPPAPGADNTPPSDDQSVPPAGSDTV